LEPSPWHCMLWSSWNLVRASEPEGQSHLDQQQLHDRALLTNPEGFALAQRLAEHHLQNGQPYQATLLLDKTESRAGDRRFDIGYHGILRAITHLMIQVEEEGCVTNPQEVKRDCGAALSDSIWCYVATAILQILSVEGALSQPRPDFPTTTNSTLHNALAWVQSGFKLVEGCRCQQPDSEALQTWQADSKIGQFYRTLEEQAQFHTLHPLFQFYAKRYCPPANTRRVSAQVYQQLCR
jgi:hypothetical protein